MYAQCTRVAAASLFLLGIAAGQVVPFVGEQEAKLTESPPMAASLFGFSSALSGDTAVVGAWLEDTDAGIDAGAAYVFVRNGNSWAQQAKLTASDAATADRFGKSVSISGNTIVVSSYTADTSGGQDSGAVYVFVRSGTSWSEQAKLTTADATAGALFGYSVALSGETAVIGAIFDFSPGAGGSAYVFVRDGTVWSQQAKLTASDASSDDLFGIAVAVAADTIVVGAENEDQGGFNAGAAYVFVRTGTAWSREAKLVTSDPTPLADFGNAVSVSGDTAIVGAEGAGAGTIGNAGAAYVFERSFGTWSEQAKLVHPTPASGDDFGGSVAIKGDLAVVGCPSDNNGAVLAAGSAHVFVRTGTTWSEQAALLAPDPVADSHFSGFSTAIDGDTLLLGAEYDAPGGIRQAGSAYVFRLVTIGTWAPLGLGLAGTSGIPVLGGSGYLLQGLPITLSLAQAKPFSFASLVVGVSAISAPFKSGIMVPNPDFIFPLFTDFFGASSFGGLWPAGVPSGFTTYFQWWIQDPAGPKGFAASNALAGTTP